MHDLETVGLLTHAECEKLRFSTGKAPGLPPKGWLRPKTWQFTGKMWEILGRNEENKEIQLAKLGNAYGF